VCNDRNLAFGFYLTEVINVAVCIWCKEIINSRTRTDEHIIPEPLGNPPGFMLELCRPCNNNLGHLDQSVINEFDIFIFNAGVPRKRGKPPIISNRGNVVGRVTPTGPEIHINMESHQVISPTGITTASFRGSNRNIKSIIKQDDDTLNISLEFEMFTNRPKFVRGIYKIGFSSLAYFLGTEVAIRNEFDSIREFVVHGKGDRKILIRPCTDTFYKNEVSPPFIRNEDEYGVRLRLVYFEFLIDLSPNHSLFPIWLQESRRLYGDNGWKCLP
jgi:hypothetical protein